MAELLLELYSEEIPPQLQIGARNQLSQFFEKSFEEESIQYKKILIYYVYLDLYYLLCMYNYFIDLIN